MQKSSSASQRELDEFYRKVTAEDFCVRTMTKGAFTQARSKLSHTVFQDLDKKTKKIFYAKAPYFRWDKFRLLVIDGSTIQLPTHESTIEEFGQYGMGPNSDSKKCIARISLLYDPLNYITIDAQIASWQESESTLCRKHLDHLKKGDLVVFDRYYASLDLMGELKKKQAEFVFRMKDNWWNIVEEFQNENCEDKIVKLPHGKKKITVRLVKHKHKEDGSIVLCTSLVNKKKYTIEDIGEVYSGRWGVEEGFKKYKNWSDLENFSGKTSLAIKQDFYAKIFMMNLGSAYAHPIEEKILKESDGNYKINRVQVIRSTRDIVIINFIRQKIKKGLRMFDELISRTIEMIRPGRVFQRKIRNKLKYNPNSNYKVA